MTARAPRPVAAALAEMEAAKVVPVIRASGPERALAAAEALVAGGMPVVEIAFTTPDAAEVIRSLAGRGVTVGAGTVLDARTATRAIEAGAAFIVSPHTDLAVLEAAKDADVLAIPGALTPAEAFAAYRAGAAVVKIFPVEAVGGPRYLELLRDPFPGLRFFPTGGVTLEDVPRYLAVGAVAVGVGGALVPPASVEAGDARALVETARRWRRAVSEV